MDHGRAQVLQVQEDVILVLTDPATLAYLDGHRRG